ncbi:hypothetical protein ABZP36_026622 [Zizania latifolia]
MAKLAAQLKDKFFGLVGRITCSGCGRAKHKDAAAGAKGTHSAAAAAASSHQQTEIRSRGVPPSVSGGSKPHTN